MSTLRSTDTFSGPNETVSVLMDFNCKKVKLKLLSVV